MQAIATLAKQLSAISWKWTTAGWQQHITHLGCTEAGGASRRRTFVLAGSADASGQPLELDLYHRDGQPVFAEINLATFVEMGVLDDTERAQRDGQFRAIFGRALAALTEALGPPQRAAELGADELRRWEATELAGWPLDGACLRLAYRREDIDTPIRVDVVLGQLEDTG